MGNEPDETLPPGAGPVIDVTPKSQRKKKAKLDFESDTPLIEQMLKEHKLDRSDRTEKQGCFAKTVFIFALCLAGLAGIIGLAYYIFA